MIFICGPFTYGRKKPCKTCKHFVMWGVNAGTCLKFSTEMLTWEHCKYYKRNSVIWTKDAVCKVDENMLYV